ncbi:hypothetical protein BJ165DRAFT_1548513 [Panaeolus papilionaceus]|nr:hypothetical protein BJ165DRAFT_1548513 [Panaeolus papilionaceus]
MTQGTPGVLTSTLTNLPDIAVISLNLDPGISRLIFDTAVTPPNAPPASSVDNPPKETLTQTVVDFIFPTVSATPSKTSKNHSVAVVASASVVLTTGLLLTFMLIYMRQRKRNKTAGMIEKTTASAEDDDFVSLEITNSTGHQDPPTHLTHYPTAGLETLQPSASSLLESPSSSGARVQFAERPPPYTRSTTRIAQSFRSNWTAITDATLPSYRSRQT